MKFIVLACIAQLALAAPVINNSRCSFPPPSSPRPSNLPLALTEDVAKNGVPFPASADSSYENVDAVAKNGAPFPPSADSSYENVDAVAKNGAPFPPSADSSYENLEAVAKNGAAFPAPEQSA